MRLIAVLITAGAISISSLSQDGEAVRQLTTNQNRDLAIARDRPSNPVPLSVPRSYALVVGVAHYEKLPVKAQLQFADRDAELIYTTLISAEGGQFPAENVHRLINETATLQNLRYELEEWLPSVTRPDDRVLIYFAGHGLISAGKAYLAPYDVDAVRIANTAYPMEDLGKVVGGRIFGKWKVLLTDACHSGALTPEVDMVRVNQRLLDLDKSMFSLTASRDREQSFEGTRWDGGHGVFTYFVVKGLQGEADASGDGIVTADELAEYVHTNVRAATEMRQNPTSERGSFDPNMVLAYNSDRRRATQLGSTQYGAMVIETNMDDTEVWIDNKDGGKVDRGKPLRLDGLLPGPHIVKGVHAGYEPDGPREEQIYPGQDTTVTLRLLIPRHHSGAAQELFDRGIDYYNRGYEGNYRHAVDEFQRALALDPQDSRAALFLGRAYSSLYEMQNAARSMRRAIEIDPDYYEARTSYAAVMLDMGNFDEAVRQLDLVTRRVPTSGMAWYLLSQAYVRKDSYGQAIVAAHEAVHLTPHSPEAHLWLAEALRLNSFPDQAEVEYKQYLSLSNFDSNALGKVNYYVLGSLFGMGTRKRAAQADIWREQRAQAKLGLCDCEWLQRHLETAEQYCLEALSLQGDDMFTNYRLGLIEAELYNARGSVAMLAAARRHFGSVVTGNPDTAEANRARQYLANIDVVLQNRK